MDDLYAVSEVSPRTFDDISTTFVVLGVPESKVGRTDRQTDGHRGDIKVYVVCLRYSKVIFLFIMLCFASIVGMTF